MWWREPRATSGNWSPSSTAVAQTAWRWPVIAAIVISVADLFLPTRLWKYDPLDRMYQRIESVLHSNREATPHQPSVNPATNSKADSDTAAPIRFENTASHQRVRPCLPGQIA